MYGPPRICKCVLRRERQVGLRKCIRPTDGDLGLLATMEIRARLAYKIAEVYDDRFFRSGLGRVG